jgi:hypothetical protein
MPPFADVMLSLLKMVLKPKLISRVSKKKIYRQFSNECYVMVKGQESVLTMNGFVISAVKQPVHFALIQKGELFCNINSVNIKQC